MDECHYLNLIVGYAVHQSVSEYEDFPIARLAPLRDDSTALRQGRETCGHFKSGIKHLKSALMGSLRDELYCCVEICLCSRRPNYPAAPRVHFFRNSSATFSCGTF